MRARVILVAATALAAAALALPAKADAVDAPRLRIGLQNGVVTLVDDPGHDTAVTVGLMHGNPNGIWVKNHEWALEPSAQARCVFVWNWMQTVAYLDCGPVTGMWAAMGDGVDVVTMVPTTSGHSSMVDLGPGNDVFAGGNWNDTVKGGDGNDVIAGSGGNDVIDGGAGADAMDGGKIGTGSDEARWRSSKVGVSVQVDATGKGTSSEGDRLTGSFEKVVGTQKADKLENSYVVPSGQKFELNGGGGNDQLVAKNGAPTKMVGATGKKDAADGRNGAVDIVCASEKFVGDPNDIVVSKTQACPN